MSDINLIYDETIGLLDIDPVNKQEDIITSVYVSLFTDLRAQPRQITLPQYRRGVAAYVGIAPPNQRGSLIWTYLQSDINHEVVNLTVSYARAALAWMIEENILTQINIDATNTADSITLNLALYKNNGEIKRVNVNL